MLSVSSLLSYKGYYSGDVLNPRPVSQCQSNTRHVDASVPFIKRISREWVDGAYQRTSDSKRTSLSTCFPGLSTPSLHLRERSGSTEETTSKAEHSFVPIKFSTGTRSVLWVTNVTTLMDLLFLHLTAIACRLCALPLRLGAVFCQECVSPVNLVCCSKPADGLCQT